jgi:pyruvate dehydrogenase E2 component (dihydrolipoamide acetyltransferase)
MAELLRVPEVAAGATEVVLSEWLVQDGASVSAGDPVAVVETEKAVVEIEAPGDAVLLRTLVTSGTEVAVGSPMALLGSDAEKGSDLDALLAELGVGPEDGGRPAAPRREVPEPEAESPAPGQDPPPQQLDDAAPRNGSASSESSESSEGTTRRIFVTPVARRMLEEGGIRVEDVVGSGPHGRIVRRDVEAALAAQQAPAEPAEPPAQPAEEPAPAAPAPARPAVGAGWTDVPHSRMRRAVAQRLTRSKQEVPHFYLTRSARIDALLDLRRQVNERSSVRISVNDFLLRAVAVAHQAVPDANVIWTEDGMRRFDAVDISVAVASERGLVTPVLRSVESRSLSSVSAQVKAFVADADAGKLQQKDLEGGSISVTNLGMYGVEEFAAIINPPQSAILAVGAGRQVPAVVDGEVAVVTEMRLVLSVDHRAIDGALAARWMTALVEAVESPLSLLV